MLEKRELVEKIVEIANYNPELYDFDSKEEMIEGILTDDCEEVNLTDLNRVIFFVRYSIEHQPLVTLMQIAENNGYKVTMYGNADHDNHGWIEVFLIREKPNGGID